MILVEETIQIKNSRSAGRTVTCGRRPPCETTDVGTYMVND